MKHLYTQWNELVSKPLCWTQDVRLKKVYYVGSFIENSQEYQLIYIKTQQKRKTGMNYKVEQEMSRGDKYIRYLNYADGFIQHICQNLSDCTLLVNFIAQQLNHDTVFF